MKRQGCARRKMPILIENDTREKRFCFVIIQSRSKVTSEPRHLINSVGFLPSIKLFNMCKTVCFEAT